MGLTKDEWIDVFGGKLRVPKPEAEENVDADREDLHVLW